MKQIECELDKELFTCCKCKGEFSHIDGTWLPVDIEQRKPITRVGETLYLLNHRPPEIITSDEFTCYNCIV